MDNTKKIHYSQIFVDSAINIFRKELKIEVLKKRNIILKNSPIPSFYYAVIIGFMDKVIKGQVVYSMPDEFGKNIAKIMMPGLLPVEYKKLITESLGELANLISGYSTAKLSKDDSNPMEITPPVVLKGENIQFDFLKVPCICVVLDSTLGCLEINIAFQGIVAEQ